jgi:hypothetical protein
VGFSSLTFDSSSANRVKKGSLMGEEKTIKEIPKATPPKFNAEQNDMGSEEKIKLTLKRYDLILSKEKKIEKIISLEFNRIVCFMQLARISRIKSGGKILVKDEELYLKKSLSIIEEIFNKSKSEKFLSEIYNFQGIIFLDLGLKEKSRQSFEKAVDLNPNAQFVPSIGIYLADLLYDEGQLEKALEAYKRFYSKMSQQEKDLVNYKVAWIYLNQSKIDQAVDLFLNIVKKSNSPSVVQDSITSLAVALSERFDQEYILAQLENTQIPPDRSLKVLKGIYESFLRLPQKDRSKIWEKILNGEHENEEIVKFLSTELEVIQFGDNIAKEVFVLRKISKYFTINQKKIKSFNVSQLASLSGELERLISKALEIYQKEKKDNWYMVLNLTLDTYLKNNVFQRQLEVMSLQLDLLTERKDDKKLMILCKEILDNPVYLSLVSKAKLLILLNYEKKYTENPKENRDKFFNLAKIYLKNLQADQWGSVASKFSEYLINESMFSDAEEVILNLYKVSPKDDYLLKLITIKFEQKKCTDVLSLLSEKKELSQKLVDYKRECHLIKAQEAKINNSSIDNYEKSIQDFIALSDGVKKNAAIADYLTTLDVESKKNNDQAKIVKYQDLLEHRFIKYRFEKEIFPIYQREILRLVDNGEFQQAANYLNGCEKNQNCTPFLKLQSNLNQIVQIDSTKNLDSFKKDTVDSEMIKYVSLIHPEELIKASLNDVENFSLDPRIILVSARLSVVDWADPKFKKNYDKIESLLSKEEKPYVFAQSWIKLNKVNLPQGTKLYLKDQDIMWLMQKVQKTRPVILSDLGTYSVVAQKILIAKAIEVENRMAEIIKLSPVPSNLDAGQIKEYQTGLGKLASEFDIQSDTYRKSLTSLEQPKNDLVLNPYEQLTVNPSLELWEWGEDDKLRDKTKDFVKNEKYVQALFYLDYLLSNSKIKKEDYFSKRSGVLLFSAIKRNKIQPMIKYVFDECEVNKQSEMLKTWAARSKK